MTEWTFTTIVEGRNHYRNMIEDARREMIEAGKIRRVG